MYYVYYFFSSIKFSIMLFSTKALRFKMKLKKYSSSWFIHILCNPFFPLLLFKYTYLFKTPATVYKYLKSKVKKKKLKKQKFDERIIRLLSASFYIIIHSNWISIPKFKSFQKSSWWLFLIKIVRVTGIQKKNAIIQFASKLSFKILSINARAINR